MSYFDFENEQWDYITQTNNIIESNYSSFATSNQQAKRKFDNRVYGNNLLRSNFAVDIDRIQHHFLFNRGTDKTQVFSFYHNDDITRRASHVQLVSRIARTIGRALRLNLDLIEAIALGHDMGHTPFGHKGEEFLRKLHYEHTKNICGTGRYFNHNVHSVRVFMCLTDTNLTIQTLDGILCHNGEKGLSIYEPAPMRSYNEFENLVEECYINPNIISTLHPCTLEGCVVRISDIIAYLGKDRQDAARLKINGVNVYEPNVIGVNNKEIIDNVIRNIVKNSIGKPYIKMDEEVLEAIEQMRKENNRIIYNSEETRAPYYEIIQPMMELMYERLLDDYKGNFESPLYRHHIGHPAFNKCYYGSDGKISENKYNIVMDYIASMSDDYFLDLFRYLFDKKGTPHELSEKIHYMSYFSPQYMGQT